MQTIQELLEAKGVNPDKVKWLKAGVAVVLALLVIVMFGNRVVVRNVAENPGFESGTNGWYAHDGYGGIEITKDLAHSGRQAVAAVGRTTWWAGPEQSMLGRLQAGRSYVCSGWVRVRSGEEEPVKMSIRQRDGNGTRYHDVSTTTASSNRWHFFSGRFDFEPVEPLTELVVYLEGPGRGVDLLVDDVRVVPDRFLLLLSPAGSLLAVLGGGFVFGLAARRTRWSARCGIGVAAVGVGLLASWLVDHRSAVVVGPDPDYAKTFRALGFENMVRGASLEIREEVREPTIYQAAGVRIYGNCTTNLAIVAKIAEIHGRVQGKVFFRGGKITIMPQAELAGGIDSSGQVVRRGVIRSRDSAGSRRTTERTTE